MAKGNPTQKGKSKPPKPPLVDPGYKEALQAFKNYSAFIKRFQARPFGQEIGIASRMFPEIGGSTLTNTQMRRRAAGDVRSILGPQMQQLGDLYKRRSAQGTQAYKDFTNTYSGRLGQIAQNVIGANNASFERVADSNAALGDFVRDRGASLQEGLAHQMAQINAPEGTVTDVVGGIGNLGFGTSNEVAMSGGIGLERMGGEMRADNAFASMLPGFGILEGQRELANFQGGLNEDFRDQATELASRMPELAYNVYNQLLSQQNDRQGLQSERSQAILNYLSDAQQRALNTNIAGAGVAESLAGMASDMYGNQLGAATDIYGTQAGLYSDQQAAAAEKKAAGVSDSTFFAETVSNDIYQTLAPNFAVGLGIPKLSNRAELTQLRQRIKAMITSNIPGVAKNKGTLNSWTTKIMRQLGQPWPPPGKNAAGGGTKGSAGAGRGPTGPPPEETDMDWTKIFGIPIGPLGGLLG